MAHAAFLAPAFVGAASIGLSVFLALPVAMPGRPATLVLFPGQQQSVLAALTRLDPETRLLGSRAGGLLLTVAYRRADLPAQLNGTGVLAVVGAGAFGCHSQVAAVLP
jgi:hypothetical protein